MKVFRNNEKLKFYGRQIIGLSNFDVSTFLWSFILEDKPLEFLIQ